MYSLTGDLDSAHFLDFGTFVSVCKYLLFMYSLNGDFDFARFLILELLFLYLKLFFF